MESTGSKPSRILSSKGQCLCGAVRYKIAAAKLLAYQCHCSICRKTTGSAFSTTVMVPEGGYEWLKGEDKISSYSGNDGYKHAFCSYCGSPVPNRFRVYPLYSVPVGGLERDDEVAIAVQLHLDSKAQWEKEEYEGVKFGEMPSLDEMMRLLHID